MKTKLKIWLFHFPISVTYFYELIFRRVHLYCTQQQSGSGFGSGVKIRPKIWALITVFTLKLNIHRQVLNILWNSPWQQCNIYQKSSTVNYHLQYLLESGTANKPGLCTGSVRSCVIVVEPEPYKTLVPDPLLIFWSNNEKERWFCSLNSKNFF
jgi:hypothetical protein